MSVYGSGRNKEQAIENFLDRLKNYKKRVINSGKDFLTAKWASEKCIEGLQKIVSSERDIKPKIRYLNNLKVHFYDVRNMEKNAGN